jgi:N-acetylneuraminate synthase/sialic acid synthase
MKKPNGDWGMFPKTDSKQTFNIAEVGQNHQGDVRLAEKYVDTFSSLGANAIKFQMRDNKSLFSAEMYERSYNSENSFGRTYGQHREALELSMSDFRSLRKRCSDLGVKFMVTPFDEPSLDRAIDLDVDILKIASFDLGNIPFLESINTANKPTVISTGGGQREHFIESLKIFSGRGVDVAVLHCVSLYPCSAEKMNLTQIEVLKTLAAEHAIGLSDHFNGILSGSIAYMLGARVFEKHVTFDRSQKGTDHSFSLEPTGFKKFCRDLQRTPEMMVSNYSSKGNEPVFQKLGKTIIVKEVIDEGDRFSSKNLGGQINGGEGIPIREISSLLGKRASRHLLPGDVLQAVDLPS